MDAKFIPLNLNSNRSYYRLFYTWLKECQGRQREEASFCRLQINGRTKFGLCYNVQKKKGDQALKIVVVDGQGGGIGRLIVEKLRQALGASANIIGLGTNAVASSAMLKAGANEGASGENAVIYNVRKADCIVGSIAIIAANSFAGELSPRMAEAIASADAVKILIPLNRAGIKIPGITGESLPLQVDQLVEKVQELGEQMELA